MLHRIHILLFLLTLLGSFSCYACEDTSVNTSISTSPISTSPIPDTDIPDKPEEEMEELEDIEWFVKHPPSGIIFTTREYEEDAMSWVAIRLNYYIFLLRKAHPELPIAVLAHGDEVASLSNKSASEYKKLHQYIQSWEKQGIVTHACGTMAHMLGLDESSFPNYIDIVPYGPSQVKDYMELGHEHIELELTW